MALGTVLRSALNDILITIRVPPFSQFTTAEAKVGTSMVAMITYLHQTALELLQKLTIDMGPGSVQSNVLNFFWIVVYYTHVHFCAN